MPAPKILPDPTSNSSSSPSSNKDCSDGESWRHALTSQHDRILTAHDIIDSLYYLGITSVTQKEVENIVDELNTSRNESPVTQMIIPMSPAEAKEQILSNRRIITKVSGLSVTNSRLL